MIKTTYSDAILSGFDYLLKNYPEVFVLGQGLWSPWYVGNTMKNLDKKYGKERIIDTPVSESACTGAAVGASICGMKPIIVHPRMDFMLYAMDSIVNQAAKWSYMFGGKLNAPVTIRSIINRGGCNLSFAGLKTAVLKISKNIKNEQDKFDLAASFQKTIEQILYKKTKIAFDEYEKNSNP